MKQQLDLTGQRFNKLLALYVCGRNKHRARIWMCLCGCGVFVQKTTQALRQDNAYSCGCERRQTHEGLIKREIRAGQIKAIKEGRACRWPPLKKTGPKPDPIKQLINDGLACQWHPPRSIREKIRAGLACPWKPPKKITTAYTPCVRRRMKYGPYFTLKKLSGGKWKVLDIRQTPPVPKTMVEHKVMAAKLLAT